MSMKERITQQFTSRFKTQPAAVIRAPGRVNLIGEHTDYNDGFVLPMAIDRYVWIALQPRSDAEVRVYSLTFNEMQTFLLGGLVNKPKDHKGTGWIEYLKGVTWAMQHAGYTLQGWDGVLAGDVPIDAGLSSSAALEIAAARSFAFTSGVPWDAAVMAKIGQLAENEWVGVNCGIMDQMISAAGKADHALLIDCRSLETEAFPLPPGTVTVVMDTATRRGLLNSAYNERRAQCDAAARFFGVSSLREVPLMSFEARANELEEVIRRRTRHVITENARTLEATRYMRRGDALRFGQLMNESHKSLRSDFEVSSEALDAIVDCAHRTDGCFGARMTGAGFGGCAVALVRKAGAENFARAVEAQYKGLTGLTPNIYISRAANGAELV